MMLSALLATTLLATSLSASQDEAAPARPVPLDVSAERVEVFDPDGKAIYAGNVNALRGDARIRADRVEVFFQPSENGGFGDVTRLIARGEVFYVTPEEVARGDVGEYDVAQDTIILTGDVVLTQGCNVSTGHRLVARVEGGYSQLEGGQTARPVPGQQSGRVRTIFYNTEDEGDNESAPRSPQDCEQPEIPGGDPVAFEDPDTNDLGEPQGDAQEASDSDLDNGLTGSGETATSEGE